MSDPFDFLPNNWSDVERNLWSSFDNAFYDELAQTYFHEAYFSPGAWDKDQVSAIREKLDEYLWDEYGIEFSDIFDWEAWREAYE